MWPIPQEASTTALLHDIGKLILSRHVRRHMQLGMRRACRQEGLSGLHAESAVLQINHAELGGMIVRHWGLPESIASGVTYHHHPDDAPADSAVDVIHAVHIADVAAKLVMGGAERDYLSIEELTDSLKHLGFAPSALRELCATVERRTDEVLATYA